MCPDKLVIRKLTLRQTLELIDVFVSSILQENVRSRARQPAVDSPRMSDALKEAAAKFLRQLSDHGRAPWPALLKLGCDTRALEVCADREVGTLPGSNGILISIYEARVR